MSSLIRTIRAKKEAVYGTPETLAAADAIEFLRGTATITAISGQRVVIDLARPDIDESVEFHTGTHSTIEFDILCDGGGTAVDTPPQWADLIEACATSETVTAATEVDYDPVSASMDSVTIEFNMNGEQHVIAGSRGNMQIIWNINSVAMIRFTFMGFYAAPTSTAQPTVDYTGWQNGIVVDNGTWGTMTLHGQAISCREFTFNMNIAPFYFETSAGEEVKINSRGATMNMLWEKLAYGTFNPYTIAKAHTLAAFSGSITGGGAGRLVEVTASNTQITDPSEESVENTDMTRARIKCTSTSAGNDSFQITTR